MGRILEKARKARERIGSRAVAIVAVLVVIGLDLGVVACTVGQARRTAEITEGPAVVAAGALAGDTAAEITAAGWRGVQDRLAHLEAERGADSKMGWQDWLYVLGLLGANSGATALGVNAHRNRTRARDLEAVKAATPGGGG